MKDSPLKREWWIGRSHTPIVLAVAALAAVAVALNWHNYVPILGFWEDFTFFYNFGAAESHLSFAIAPRANIGGQGYPLLDLGIDLTTRAGWSLASFRTIVFVYALATYGAMLVVFSRWFGLLPGLFGVTLTVLSTGFIVFANQALVMMPTLLLCVLLVERLQKLDQDMTALAPKFAIAVIVALLLIHYGMGRFFAVGWLAFFFGQRVLTAWRELPAGPPFRDYLKLNLAAVATIVILALVLTCLAEPRNVLAFADPWNLFFPRNGVEVEMAPAKLLSTVFSNIPLLLEMLFPFVKVSGHGHVEGLLSGQRAAILNVWHTPFLLVGIAVALRRTFHALTPTVTPYLALHVLASLTIGLTVFSQQYGPNSTISPYRVFCGFFAVAGYITVSAHQIGIAVKGMVPRLVHTTGMVVSLLLFGTAAYGLSTNASDLRNAFAAKAKVETDTGTFIQAPKTLTYGDDIDTYRQARFKYLAAALAPRLRCASRDRTVLLQLSPRLLFINGKYRGLHYLRNFNDLSGTLAFYLSDLGINAAFLIIHGRKDKGIRDRGHGYGGRPRIFSGPITWQEDKLLYVAGEPLVYDLRMTRPAGQPEVLVTFSDTETQGARRVFTEKGHSLEVIGQITSVRQLSAPTWSDPEECRKN